jgi:hypothetical protein
MRAFLVLISFVLISGACAAQDVIPVLTAHAPQYPPIALAEGAAEDIEVNVLVNEKGEVLDARASSGVNNFLRQESEKAAKKWVFSKSDAAKRQFMLHFDYVVLHPPQGTGPDIEFSVPFTVTIRQHQPETSGPLPHK